MPLQLDKPMSAFAQTILINKDYAHLRDGKRESWDDIASRVAYNVAHPYLPQLTDKVRKRIASRQLMPAGRYLYAAGRKYHQVNNCFMLACLEDSREEWGRILDHAANCLMVGGGIGIVYSILRGAGSVVNGLGGKSTGPCSLAGIVNEAGRRIMQGGSRRSAIWAGLLWSHSDIFKFIHMKDWSPETRSLKAKDFNFPAEMDMTNISVILDTAFFDAFENSDNLMHYWAQRVYNESVEGMLRTGEPGFSIDIGENESEHLRNACTEATSRDDGDMCNLASLNMARFSRLEDFAEAVEEGVGLLICGSLYSKLPIQSMYKVREKNRRIGLGLMGIHEWLLKRNYRYDVCDELKQWLEVYAQSGAIANRYCDKLSISRPIATRSIAPTGTISIIAETTSGIEPIFSTAYKRRYLEGLDWKYQYVVDATTNRLVEDGVDPSLLEDAHTLAEDTDRRLQFQVFLQKYVDQGISSTLNLPTWGSSVNNESTVDKFKKSLYKTLPYIRGMTAYPNGARDGQPLNHCTYMEAIKHLGTIFSESGAEESCKSGVCGT